MNIAFRKILGSGLQVVKQTIWKEAARAQNPVKEHVRLLETKQLAVSTFSNHFRRLALAEQRTSGRVWKVLSVRLRQDAIQRLFSPLGRGIRLKTSAAKTYIPYLTFGFVGLALTDDNGKSHNCESFSGLNRLQQLSIREAHKREQGKLTDDIIYPDKLKGYEISDNSIGRGSFGAIYSARISQKDADNGILQVGSTNEDDSMESSNFVQDLSEGRDDKESSFSGSEMERDDLEFISQEEMEVDSSKVSSACSSWSLTGSSSELVPVSHPAQEPLSQDGPCKMGLVQRRSVDKSDGKEAIGKIDGEFNLAMKFVFNNRIQSDSTAIEAAFESEKILLTERLPPHPNIVKVHQAFVDDNILPRFKDAEKLFPYALPRVQFETGLGRNMLMYLVMHRYEMTLKEYLKRFPCRNEETAKLMLCQLLEGGDHLRSFNIAHRDLKDDNILVERDSSGVPRLVITDFGCCLAPAVDSDLRFSVPPWLAVGMAGNIALRAPEIKTALLSQWPYAEFDYRKSDGWALGTIAYQICGMGNPFYQKGVDSLSYQEDSLPKLPNYITPEFEFIILGLLQKNPKERLSCVEAADMIHLLLWKPDYWNKGPVNLRKLSHLRGTLQEWLYQISPMNPRNAEENGSAVKKELLATFLYRVRTKGLRNAAKTLIFFQWQQWLDKSISVFYAGLQDVLV